MRYHINGHYVEERRKGFPVHHQIEKDLDHFSEILEIINVFSKDYNENYCYGMSIGISEEPSLVE